MSVHIKIEMTVVSANGTTITGSVPINLPRVSQRFETLLSGAITDDLLLADTVSGAIQEIDVALREPVMQVLGQIAQNTVELVKSREVKAEVKDGN